MNATAKPYPLATRYLERDDRGVLVPPRLSNELWLRCRLEVGEQVVATSDTGTTIAGVIARGSDGAPVVRLEADFEPAAQRITVFRPARSAA